MHLKRKFGQEVLRLHLRQDLRSRGGCHSPNLLSHLLIFTAEQTPAKCLHYYLGSRQRSLFYFLPLGIAIIATIAFVPPVRFP